MAPMKALWWWWWWWWWWLPRILADSTSFFNSSMSRFSLARRFWNQVMTWALVNPNVRAIYRQNSSITTKCLDDSLNLEMLPHRGRQVTGTSDRGTSFPVQRFGDWWRPSATCAFSSPAGVDWTTHRRYFRFLRYLRRDRFQFDFLKHFEKWTTNVSSMNQKTICNVFNGSKTTALNPLGRERGGSA